MHRFTNIAPAVITLDSKSCLFIGALTSLGSCTKVVAVVLLAKTMDMVLKCSSISSRKCFHSAFRSPRRKISSFRNILQNWEIELLHFQSKTIRLHKCNFSSKWMCDKKHPVNTFSLRWRSVLESVFQKHWELFVRTHVWNRVDLWPKIKEKRRPHFPEMIPPGSWMYYLVFFSSNMLISAMPCDKSIGNRIREFGGRILVEKGRKWKLGSVSISKNIMAFL